MTATDIEAVERLIADFAVRRKNELDPGFMWELVEGPNNVALRQSLLDVLQSIGAARLAEDWQAVRDTVVESFAIVRVSNEDFRIIAAAAACPTCGRIEHCVHQGDAVLTHGPGGLIVNRAPEVLRTRLRAAAHAARAELAKTRAQRIAEQKAATLQEIAEAAKEVPSHVP